VSDIRVLATCLKSDVASRLWLDRPVSRTIKTNEVKRLYEVGVLFQALSRNRPEVQVPSSMKNGRDKAHLTMMWLERKANTLWLSGGWTAIRKTRKRSVATGRFCNRRHLEPQRAGERVPAGGCRRLLPNQRKSAARAPQRTGCCGEAGCDAVGVSIRHEASYEMSMSTIGSY
jgi:hypothetical protein